MGTVAGPRSHDEGAMNVSLDGCSHAERSIEACRLSSGCWSPSTTHPAASSARDRLLARARARRLRHVRSCDSASRGSGRAPRDDPPSGRRNNAGRSRNPGSSAVTCCCGIRPSGRGRERSRRTRREDSFYCGRAAGRQHRDREQWLPVDRAPSARKRAELVMRRSKVPVLGVRAAASDLSE
jgi:hypothetical protein